MKRHRNHLFILLALLTLTFTAQSCKKEGCMDVNSMNYDPDAKKDDGSCEYGHLMLHFHPMAGTQEFAFNQEYTLSTGRKVMFTIAQFYTSGFTLKGDEPLSFPDTYHLITPDQMMYDIGELKSNHYHGIQFNVGVDSVANHSDPATYPEDHALAPKVPGMHWAWASGYQFIKIEGMVDTTAAMTGNADSHFEMHIGTDALLRNIDLTKHGDATTTEDYVLHVMVDFLAFLDGVDMANDNTTHTMDGFALAELVADNAVNAISVQ